MLGGEREAFDRFCDEYVPQLYRFARRRLRGDDDVTQEVVQSTVCKAIRGLGSFRGEAALMTWLCAVCRNEIAAHFRRRTKHDGEIALDALETDTHHVLVDHDSPDPETTAMRAEGRERIHDVLDTLPPHYSDALQMKYVEGLSTREIADRLELSAKATESLLTRARVRFRQRYSRAEDPVTAPPRERGTVAPLEFQA